MADTSTPKGSMAPIPTVAEVRERLWYFGEYGLRDRLDRDKMAIVTVESLAEALRSVCPECSKAWRRPRSLEFHAADAGALMHALTTASEGGRGSKRGEK